MAKITISISKERRDFLDLIKHEDAAKSNAGAVAWCIDACMKIEKLYGIDACYISYNDIRKPENDPNPPSSPAPPHISEDEKAKALADLLQSNPTLSEYVEKCLSLGVAPVIRFEDKENVAPQKGISEEMGEEVPEQYGNVYDAFDGFIDAAKEHFPDNIHLRLEKESPNSLLPKNHSIVRRASAEWGARWMREALRKRMEDQAQKVVDLRAELSSAREKIKELQEDKDLFAMSFLVFALTDPRAIALRDAHSPVGAILNLYKDRPYLSNPINQ